MLLPLTHAQRVARFGRFRFVDSPKAGNPERVVILDGWAQQNVTEVYLPQLGRQVNVHHMAAKPFLGVWQAWEDEGYLDEVLEWNGSYAQRRKRGKAAVKPSSDPQYANAALSNHCWATAFDINADLYPLRSDDPTPRYREMVPIAERFGYFCGGLFGTRKDWMHWEYTGLAPAYTALEAAWQLLNPPIVMFRHEKMQRQALIGVKADGDVGTNTLSRAREVIRARTL